MAKWQEFDPSTFSYPGRYEMWVAETLSRREKRGLLVNTQYVDLGSGAISPFTVASLPNASRLEVVAVEPNEQLAQIAEDLKNGKAIPWVTIAGASKNPGVENNDLHGPTLVNNLQRLKAMGILANLGPEFNEQQMKIPDGIRQRVTFVHTDALSHIRTCEKPEVIGIFWLITNLLKSSEGQNYSEALLKVIGEKLSPTGQVLLGDTGRALPLEISQITSVPSVRLNVLTLTHAIQFREGNYITNYFLGVNHLDGHLLLDQNISDVRQNIKADMKLNGVSFQDIALRSSDIPGRLTIGDNGLGRNNIALAYSSRHLWLMPEEGLSLLCPQLRDEWSGIVAGPAQKPELVVRRQSFIPVNR